MELHKSHKEKVQKKRGTNIEFYQSKIYNQDQMRRSHFREQNDYNMSIENQQSSEEKLINIKVDSEDA